MKKVLVRAPVRADLAGGTLDLWPLYLFHPGSRTVNVAISFYAESEVSETGDGAIEILLSDSQYRKRYESLSEMAADPKASLLHRALEHFKLNGIRIVTRTDAPRGSGLGGSSALAVTLVRALSELAGAPVEGDQLIGVVRDLETRLLGVPAGIQDYYPPVYGGLGALHLEPGQPVRHALSTNIHDLAAHMVMHYTGVAHFSGTNNWEMYKRQIDGEPEVNKGLRRIAEVSVEMEKALQASNFAAAGEALEQEWQARKALIQGISTPEIEAAIEAAKKAGAWAGKVCGAGGGGCIVFLLPSERRKAVVDALGQVPGRVLDASPVTHALSVELSDDRVTPAPRRSQARRFSESVEQLYVYGARGRYLPYILAEGIVTHVESRSGLHHAATCSYAAPIDPADARIRWHEAMPIDPEILDIRAVPDPRQPIDAAIDTDALVQSASKAADGFKQFLEENERLQIFQNPAFGLFSEANEAREAFLERCLEEAERRVSDQQERLESTFRRRIDQLREKSEREQREIEDDDDTHPETKQDVNVAWGQTLYNITSGKPTAVADTSASVREFDYLENIAQIQKAWDRELQTLRDELTTKAREIEEITVTPSPKNIDVTKCVILWSGDLKADE